MTKAQYFHLRSELAFHRHLAVTLGVIAFDVALLVFAITGIRRGPQSSLFWVAQVLLALLYFHNFALLHEAGHGNVHSGRHLNTWIGHYASLFCFLPFFPWKYIHHEHHTWTGNLDRDPTLYQVKKMKREGRVPWIVRFAWRSWIPFGGLLQHTVFWLYPLRSWREGRLSAFQQRRSLFSVVFLAVAYLLLAAFGPAWLTFSRVWPSLVIYLIAVELVNFPHHIDMPVVSHPDHKLPPWEQHQTTRSCNYGIFSGLLVLNFNLHTEHHLYPTLPWYRLTSVRDQLKPVLAEEYHEVPGLAWNLENRTCDPEQIMLRDRLLANPSLSGELSQTEASTAVLFQN